MKNKLLLLILLFKTHAMLGYHEGNMPRPNAPPINPDFVGISKQDEQEDRVAREQIKQQNEKEQLDKRERELKRKEEAQEERRNNEPSALQKFGREAAFEAGLRVAMIPVNYACREYPLETFGGTLTAGGLAVRYRRTLALQLGGLSGSALLAGAAANPVVLGCIAGGIGTGYALNQFKKWYQSKPKARREARQIQRRA